MNLGENSFTNIIYLKFKHWLAALVKKYIASASQCEAHISEWQHTAKRDCGSYQFPLRLCLALSRRAAGQLVLTPCGCVRGPEAGQDSKADSTDLERSVWGWWGDPKCQRSKRSGNAACGEVLNGLAKIIFNGRTSSPPSHRWIVRSCCAFRVPIVEWTH